jgi:hypothetical protein
MKLVLSTTIEHRKGLQHKQLYRANKKRFEGGGENTLKGGHFGHFHNMYVKYIFAKHIAFNFGFDF